MVFEITVAISVVIFSAIYLLIWYKTDKSFFDGINSHKNESIKFSIIIAAKNEVYNLPHLISALKKLNYPAENFEVIIVDDFSQDETYLKANELLKDVKNIKVVKSEKKIFEGKKGALSQGISLASFPNIMVTDADCIPEQDWLQHFSLKFHKGYDFLFGTAPFIQTDGIVNKISCFENFRNSILSLSALNLAMPYTAAARNFGFRKAAFESIGGYKNTTETLSGDDDLLLREALKHNLKIGAVTKKGSFVFSYTKKTFKEYSSQRARHTQTSFHYLLKQKLFLAAWHLLNISFVLMPLLAAINLIFILPFSVKLSFDLISGISKQKKFEYRFSIIEIIYLQIIYEFFLIVHFIRAKFGRITWK